MQVLYPGGEADLANTTGYAKVGTPRLPRGAIHSPVLPQAGKLIWDYALARNKHSDYFPIWATCLGFEQVAMLAAEDDSVVCRDCFQANEISLPLEFAPDGPSSRMFSAMATENPELLKAAH